jgi:hypothetical protein
MIWKGKPYREIGVAAERHCKEPLRNKIQYRNKTQNTMQEQNSSARNHLVIK